jgi:hypothetical protein
MKISIALIILLGASVHNIDASATLELNNKDVSVPILGYSSPLAVGTIYVTILAGVGDGQTIIPVEQMGTGKTIFEVDQNGYFDGGVGVIPGITKGGDEVWLKLIAWYSATGEGAYYGADVRGTTAVWSQSSGSWDASLGTPATGAILNLPASPAFQVYTTPEPKTVTLSIIGGVALLTTNKVAKTFKGKTKGPHKQSVRTA